MSIAETHISRSAIGEEPRHDGFVAALVDGWKELFRTIFDPYRPERHYMRGPGPACARKRTQF